MTKVLLLAIFLVSNAAFAQTKSVKARLGKILWSVDCRGIVQENVVGVDGTTYWRNWNSLNPGSPNIELAQQVFFLTCSEAP